MQALRQGVDLVVVFAARKRQNLFRKLTEPWGGRGQVDRNHFLAIIFTERALLGTQETCANRLAVCLTTIGKNGNALDLNQRTGLGESRDHDHRDGRWVGKQKFFPHGTDA